jgi:hypothetical protein
MINDIQYLKTVYLLSSLILIDYLRKVRDVNPVDEVLL